MVILTKSAAILGGATPSAAVRGPSKWQLQDTARQLLPGSRVCTCTRAHAGGNTSVGINRSAARVWYTGLMRCGSVWLCPVCAEKIAEGRREELQLGIDLALSRKWDVALITHTFRHGAGDGLAENLEKFRTALRRMKSWRAYKRILADYGVRGEVRGLEITHGAHGWHPHTHAIWFFEGFMQTNRAHGPTRGRRPTVGIVRAIQGHGLVQLKRRLFCQWAKACKAVGLPAPVYRGRDGSSVGVDVRGAKHAAAYVAKWGFASELAKPHIKQGRQASRSMWQLLADASAGDKRAAWLWREFAGEFKGARQLFWSRGLRKALGVETEMTDQQLLDLEPDEAVEIARLSHDDWKLIVYARLRGEVLRIVAEEGPGALEAALARLRSAAGRVWGYGRDAIQAMNAAHLEVDLWPKNTFMAGL